MELMRTGEPTNKYTKGGEYEVISSCVNYPFYTIKDDQGNTDVVSINEGFREVKENETSVICDTRMPNLTEGKKYRVLEEKGQTIKILDDRSILFWYHIAYFKRHDFEADIEDSTKIKEVFRVHLTEEIDKLLTEMENSVFVYSYDFKSRLEQIGKECVEKFGTLSDGR